jgi:hypothetical protein
MPRHIKRLINTYHFSLLAKITPVLLICALLGAQIIAAHHDHDGDLSHHLDCSVCLKLSNESDILLAAVQFLDAIKSGSENLSSSQTGISSESLTAKSRSPPLI